MNDSVFAASGRGPLATSQLSRRQKRWRRPAIMAINAGIETLADFPYQGAATDDADIRQLIVRFGDAGYVVRYSVLDESGDILILRIWHGREERP